MQRLKAFGKKALNIFVTWLFKGKYSGYIADIFVDAARNTKTTVQHGETTLDFATPNRVNRWRASTFSTKEPETLEWIDSITPGTVLWDIGANVGLYSCYAAKTRGCRVFAFEPSVFNLELLARNIALNNLTSRVTIVPLPLADRLATNTLRMTSTDWGGALSTFGKDIGWDGNPINKVFEFSTIGLSIDEAAQYLAIANPQYIKMDVDGIEHYILQGGEKLLPNVKEILLEVNDDFHEQAQRCHEILHAAGFSLKEKRHSDIIAQSTSGFANSYNQIWHRK